MIKAHSRGGGWPKVSPPPFLIGVLPVSRADTYGRLKVKSGSFNLKTSVSINGYLYIINRMLYMF